MRTDNDGDLIVDINVTPLVDVALVLLIIFLATSYLIAQQSLKVELPKATKTAATEARTISVMIRRSGEIVLDGHAVTPDRLEQELSTRHHALPSVQVLVGADREVNHGRVVDVMDAARMAGIDRIAIAVDRR
jgi:biopolymer transport protein ExbD